MNKDDVLNNWMKWVKGSKPQDVLTGVSGKWSEIKTTGGLKRFVRTIPLAYGLVRDSLSGDYKGLSKTDMALIVAALAYLLLVVDIVPDCLPVLGWVDDCMVLAWVFKSISSELARYEAHRQKQRDTVEIGCVENLGAGEFGNLSHGE